MPVPDRFRSAFTSSTLKSLDTLGEKLRVAEPLFFRTAYTANVVENQRRTFAPVVVLEPSRVASWRCTCSETMRPGDLCRHIAALLARASDGNGALAGERFESSLWRAIGFALFSEAFSEARALETVEADAREQTLRRMVLTDQERALLTRGSGSTRLQWESSPWYRWSKSMFLRHGDAADAKLEQVGEGFAITFDIPSPDRRASHGDRPLPQAGEGRFLPQAGSHLPPAGEGRFLLPASAIEHVLEHPHIVRAGGFDIVRDALTPSFRITVARELTLTPVLLANGTIHDRAALSRFGRWFLLEKTFVTAKPVPPMFAERSANEQGALFDARPSQGLPLDRETIVRDDEVFAFIERHREELAAMPPALAPDSVRNALPVRLEDDVVFDFGAPHDGLLEVAIAFKAGDETIAAAEIANARKHKIRALNRGSVWIDVADSQFEWLDATTFGKSGHALVTKLELLRIRGSLRGRALFAGDRAAEGVFRMFDELQTSADAPSPASLGMDLYAYQQTGYHWLWLLQQNGFGALLCDDMGLGKTHQAMALIRALTFADPSISILVVCPTSILDHWREKLARYVPGVPVTLTSYGIVRNRIEQYREKRYDLVVLDEMQTIKNAETSTHQALRAIDKRIAIGLTGTPVENHEGELTTLLDFVVPGYLPKRVDRSALRRLVRPFVLRRTKAQVLTELPPKIVDKRYCELHDEQRALYREVMNARAKPLRALLRGGGRIPFIHVFAALNYLKQICNDPRSVGGGMATPATSGKWELFADLLDECMDSGLKVVVFSQYLAMLQLIERHLDERAIAFASIKGATRERGREIARFRDDPDCRVFTASLRAGGLGIDLTSASVVIHYDRWWNQAREDQATDRVHRLGQNKGVQVIKLITRGTVEEKIDELIARKSKLASDLIVDDDPSLVKQFSVAELEELLSE